MSGFSVRSVQSEFRCIWYIRIEMTNYHKFESMINQRDDINQSITGQHRLIFLGCYEGNLTFVTDSVSQGADQSNK